MPNDLGADLDELLPDCGQRPAADFPGKRQPAQKIVGIVCQGEELQPYLVVTKIVT